MTENDALEKETKEMEMRLQMLQERLSQQKLDEKPTTNGARWKSSKPEKGSIRAYGKEVTEKFRTKQLELENSMETNTRMSASMTISATTTERNIVSPNVATKPSVSESPTITNSSGNFTTKGIKIMINLNL